MHYAIMRHGNMASAISDSLIASLGGGAEWWGSTPSEISGTTKAIFMKLLPDVVIYKETRNKKELT